MPLRNESAMGSSVCMVWGSRWNMPIPNAGWSGSESTAIASGVIVNRSTPSASSDHDSSFAAAWLCAHSRTHRSLRSVASASCCDVHPPSGAVANARYRPSLSPRCTIPDVIAPSSLEKRRNE